LWYIVLVEKKKEDDERSIVRWLPVSFELPYELALLVHGEPKGEVVSPKRKLGFLSVGERGGWTWSPEGKKTGDAPRLALFETWAVAALGQRFCPPSQPKSLIPKDRRKGGGVDKEVNSDQAFPET
jgi:hypothetical protein